MFNIIFFVHGYFFPASHLFLCFFGWYLFKHQSDGFNGFFMLKKSHVLHNILLLFNVSTHKNKNTVLEHGVDIFV